MGDINLNGGKEKISLLVAEQKHITTLLNVEYIGR